MSRKATEINGKSGNSDANAKGDGLILPGTTLYNYTSIVAENAGTSKHPNPTSSPIKKLTPSEMADCKDKIKKEKRRSVYLAPVQGTPIFLQFIHPTSK